MLLKISLDFFLSAMECLLNKTKAILIIFFVSIFLLPFSVKAEGPAIIITEIAPNPSGDESPGEWFEICNIGSQVVSASGWYVYDNTSKDLLGDFSINPGEYLVIAVNENVFKSLYPNFSGKVLYLGDGKSIGNGLSNSGDKISLKDGSTTNANIINGPIEFGASNENESFNLIDQAWQWSNQPTPSSANIISMPEPEPEQETQNTTSTNQPSSKSSTKKSSESTPTSTSTTKTTESQTAKQVDQSQESENSEVLGTQTSENQNIYLSKTKTNNKIYGWILIITGGFTIILFGVFQWKKTQVLEFVQKIQNRPKN